MSGLPTHLRSVFAEAFDKIRKGELKTLIPFLSLFRLNGKPMNLKMHYQFSPLFGTTQAANTCVMTGRQVGKSNQMVASTLLRSMLVPYYHTMLVQPRMDQIQRLISTVYKPLLGSCPIRNEFISTVEYQKLALREFRNGSLCYAEHLFQSPDRTRGAGNLATVLFDESVVESTTLCVIENDKLCTKKISDIHAGNILLSFTERTDDIILSVATKDASFHGYRNCVRIRTVAGRTLECTLDHPLATSEGSMRVSEIIEYEYHRRGQTTRPDGVTDKRDNGKLNGRLGISCVGGALEIDRLYTRCTTDGLHKPQVHPIERCRYETSAITEEQRICGILHGITSGEPWGISLIAFPDVSGGCNAENDNQGVFIPDNASDSAGVVVYGRRPSILGNSANSNNKYARIHGAGSSPSGELAGNTLGPCCDSEICTDAIREDRVVSVVSGNVYVEADTANKGLRAGMHELQSCIQTTDLSTVRKAIPAGNTEALLFRSMQKPGGTNIGYKELGKIKRESEDEAAPVSDGASSGQIRQRTLRKTRGGLRKTASGNTRTGGSRESCETYVETSLETKQNDSREARGLDSQGESPKESCIRQIDPRTERQDKCKGTRTSQKPVSGADSERKADTERVCSQIFGQEAQTDRIASIEYIGVLPVYDIEVIGTHNYILANGLCSFNCQDIEYDFLDIVNETMSASLFWGFSMYLGTPKTTDTTLALLWNRSSQAEWIIHCNHCGYFNIPNPNHDLLKMLGKTGPVCAKCGKPIYPADGGYVHAIPDRAQTFPGYHISQTVHPLHMLENKWFKLLDKVASYSETTLYNEVFGWPADSAVSPLTLTDLMKSQHDIPKLTKPSDFEKYAEQYEYVTVGVDWGGGGAISDSYTSYAVVGKRIGTDIHDVLYGKQIKKGVSPTDEAREILSWIAGVGADAFAYDNGGAGFARMEIMKQNGLMTIPNLTICPINYVSPRSGDVMKPTTGQREPDLYYYTLDKSRSLAISITAIKACRLRFYKFSETDEKAEPREFLNLREDPSKSARNETVILITKKPGVPDDFAHAVNFACSQIWDHFGAYPRIGTRYDTSVLDFDENNNRILDSDMFGPRGDFDRFAEAVEMRAALLETGGLGDWQ